MDLFHSQQLKIDSKNNFNPSNVFLDYDRDVKSQSPTDSPGMVLSPADPQDLSNSLNSVNTTLSPIMAIKATQKYFIRPKRRGRNK